MVSAVSQGAKTVEDAAGQAIQGAEIMWDEASKAIGREDNRSWWDDVGEFIGEMGFDAAGTAISQAAIAAGQGLGKGLAHGRKDNRGWWDDVVNAVEDVAGQAVQEAEEIVDEASEALGREDNRGWWDDVVSAVEDAAQGVEDAAGQAVQEAEDYFG